MQTTIAWIEKARAVHGDGYDYSRSHFTGSHEKLTIICRIHGPFEQRAKEHLKGSGCRKCAEDFTAFLLSMSQDEFVQKAQAVHGDQYDYSQVEYFNTDTPVKILCKEHGAFEQRPSKHLRGKGCRKCGYLENGRKQRLSKEEFITRAQKIHGNKYDYGLVGEYEGEKNLLTLKCPKHGLFKQMAGNHIAGKGCRKCGYENRS